MEYPQNFDVILCEGVRREERKKLTIYGVFTGDDVVIDHGTPVESINLRLTYLVRVKDGLGETTLTWKISDPDQNVLDQSTDSFPFEMKDDGYSIVIIEFAGHKVPRYGTYNLTLDIGGHELVYKYRIKEGPA